MEGKRYDTPKPVSAGDIVEVQIESVGGKGDGIGKIDGFVIFVKGAQRDKKYKVKVVDVKRTYAMGEIVGEASESAAKEESKTGEEETPASDDETPADEPEDESVEDDSTDEEEE